MPVPRGAVGCCSPLSSTRLLLHPPRPQGLLQPYKARRVGKLLPLILQPFLPSGAGDSFSTFLSSLRHWRQKWDGCHQPSKASSRSFFPARHPDAALGRTGSPGTALPPHGSEEGQRIPIVASTMELPFPYCSLLPKPRQQTGAFSSGKATQTHAASAALPLPSPLIFISTLLLILVFPS